MDDMERFLTEAFKEWRYPVDRLGGGTLLGAGGLNIDSLTVLELETLIYARLGITLEGVEVKGITGMTLKDLAGLLTVKKKMTE